MSTFYSLNVSSNWVKYLSLGTALVVGYAVYIDRKRRLDPEYKQKIRQNRKQKQANFFYAKMSGGVDFPDPSDPQANEIFFFSQITLGEEKMQTGHIEEGITHLSNAIVTCSKPDELLRIFQQTIPPECFSLLVQAIPGARMRRNASSSYRHGREPIDLDSAKIDDIGDNAVDKKMFVFQDDELE
ncbi:hypothetical protein niasHT_007798 [Heterodera trifolii]|uniref:Mitochondrial import receptor subunit TOM20 n=1 Tax=Heterodera trifolii TaxID=157864 RepID=A0ABD2LKM8_9BILA